MRVDRRTFLFAEDAGFAEVLSVRGFRGLCKEVCGLCRRKQRGEYFWVKQFV